MTYPMKDKITESLASLGDSGDLNPVSEQHDQVTETLVSLIKTHGFDAADAYRLVRTIFWYGWNEGWTKGYASRPQNDQVQTLL